MIASTHALRSALASLLAIACATLAHAGDGAPGALLGDWDVAHVAVDGKDQAHWLYRLDDPRLLGRALHIGADAVRLNDGTPECRQAHWRMRADTLGALIGKSFERPAKAGLARRPTPLDFGLAHNGGSRVSVYTIACSPAVPKANWDRNWLVPLDKTTLLMRVDSSALLILERRSAQAPRPSYACGKAISASEKVICADHGLAAYDRSVGGAWRAALQRVPDQSARLKTEQTAWLKERDGCRDDVACLEEKMMQRIEALLQE